jgi:hypothetical protein
MLMLKRRWSVLRARTRTRGVGSIRRRSSRLRQARAGGRFRPSRYRIASKPVARLALARSPLVRARLRLFNSSRCWLAVRVLTIPTGPYESGRPCDSRMKRSITLRVGRRARNIDSGRDWAAEQSLTNQIVDGDHELANRRNTKRQPRRGQELLGQRNQGSGCALIRTLV